MRITTNIAAVATALVLAAATPAGVIAYNGHAGLGASYQHNQTDLEFVAAVHDGTSNTLMVT